MTALFGRRPGWVVARTELGPYVRIDVSDPDAADNPPRPGQFYMLAAGEGWGGGAGERPFLPRACSVLCVADGTLSFLLEDIGPGTRRLCGLAAGAPIWLTGPLGVGFRAVDGPSLVVGGGIGVAAILMLAVERGGSALLGFRDAAHAAAATLFEDCRIATDDGSAGQRGLVTELLEAELQLAPATVFACGPPAMLEAVRILCERRAADAQLALEAPMACGFGACYGCVVATRDGYRRVCVDGPVFAAERLLAIA